MSLPSSMADLYHVIVGCKRPVNDEKESQIASDRTRKTIFESSLFMFHLRFLEKRSMFFPVLASLFEVMTD